MIRPHPAEWFEILAAKDDAGLLLEALARSGCIELEPRAGTQCQPPEGLPRLLLRFESLRARFAAYWPAPAAAVPPLALEDLAARALSAVEAWSKAAAPVIETLRPLEGERAELTLWREVRSQIAAAGIDFGALAAPGAGVAGALFRFPAGTAAVLPEGVLGVQLTLGQDAGVLAVGSSQALAALPQLAAAAVERLELPAWFGTDTGPRLDAVESALRAARAELDRLATACRLAEALGWLRHVQWMMGSTSFVQSGENFCRITGWTDDRARLRSVVDSSGTRALAAFPPAPVGAEPPLLLHNPWWARSFEVFSRALGMPARYAADPSVLLAVIVPLLFGYMFGDVGQGAVLVVAGLALRRRVPVLGMLAAGGVSAMLFGVLFGSVFGLHGVVPALWLEPLDNPLPVLVVPLFGGALLLLVGLLISAVEAHWRGKLRHWLMSDAGLIAVYVGILLALLDRAWLWLAAAGALAPVLGYLVLTRRARPALGAAGALLERSVQLLINTLSFVRVGAFALAHAGLSAAMLALADTASGLVAHALILVIGNAALIVVEATIVSIQTTRLVLFEFFTRFFISKGREFRPLPPPVPLAGGLRESTS